MGNITISNITTAIATTLGAAVGLVRVQDGANDGSASEETTALSDGMNDTPTLQVYLESGGADASNSVDRTTFRAGVRQNEIVFHADAYVRQRANIGEDTARCTEMASRIWDVLEAQDVKPYFGLEGIQSYRWTMQRVVFDYAGTSYAGLRFTINIWVY